MTNKNEQSEAFARVLIDRELLNSNWDVAEPKQVVLELSSDELRLDYTLFDKNGHPICVLEAKRPSYDPYDAKEQAKEYAEKINAPFVILSNGKNHYFWELNNPGKIDAYRIEKLPTLEDLNYIKQKYEAPPDPLNSLEVDNDFLKDYKPEISLYNYQINAINVVSEKFDEDEKRQFLLEMATGTGKTLVSAAMILRFLKTRNARRVLFIVDRIELAKQTMEDFSVILKDYSPVIYKNARKNPAELLGSNVVIATIQSLMVNRRFRQDFTPFYFDLVINDEAHRSIYGDSKEAVQFFQGARIGLTATPKNYLKNTDQTVLMQDNPKAYEARQLRDTYRFFGCSPGEPTFRYDLIDAVNDPEGPFLCLPRIFDIRSDITTKALSEKGWIVQGSEEEENYKISDL